MLQIFADVLLVPLPLFFHVPLFFRSFPSDALAFPLDAFDSCGFRNSLMSSSHLFRDLPTDLLVLMLLSRPRFHSVNFFDHRSSGRVAILNAILHFILPCLYPAWNPRPVHLILRFFCTSVDIFDPSFFFLSIFSSLSS